MARAWADVSLAAVEANVRALREHVAPAEVCAVVKADGYGHGAVPVARAAVAAGATWLAVAQVPEATALRDGGITAPVLLLSEPRRAEVAEALAAEVAISLYSPELIDRVGAAADPSRPVSVHLKVDTGMHRVGVAPEALLAAAKAVVAPPVAVPRRRVDPLRGGRRARPARDGRAAGDLRGVPGGAGARGHRGARCATPPTRRRPSPTPPAGTTSCAAASPSTASRRPRPCAARCRSSRPCGWPPRCPS